MKIMGRRCCSLLVLLSITNSNNVLAKLAIFPVPLLRKIFALYPYVYILEPGKTSGRKSRNQNVSVVFPLESSSVQVHVLKGVPSMP
jgi:hypothetical protein